MSTEPPTTIFRWNKNLRNILIYFFSSGFSRSIPFFLLPLLTRVLSPSDFGILGLTTVLITLCTPLINFSAPGYIYAHYFKYPQEEINHKLSVISNLAVYMSFTLALALSVLFYLRVINFYLPIWTLLLIVVIAYSISMLNMAQIINQIETRISRYVTYEILTAVLIGSLVIVLILILGMKWEGRFLAGAGGYGIIGMAALVYLVRSRSIAVTFDPASLKEFLRFSLPILPHTLGIWALNGIARLFLIKYVSMEEAGYFQVAFQLTMILALFYEAMFKVWNPFFYRHVNLADDNPRVKNKLVRYSYYYVGAGLVLAAGFLLISQILIHVFVYEKFARSGVYLVWLVLGMTAYNMTRTFTGYLYHTGKTKLLGMTTALSALVNIALAFTLNRFNGPVGVAQATFLAFVVHASLITAFALRAYPMPWLHPFRRK